MLQIVPGDITTLDVDVIVNAANAALAGGGGVDGAIHRAAGPELMVACRKLGRCPTGGVVMTQGYQLPARYVIHAVGPVWRGGGRNEARLLADCYEKSLLLTRQYGLTSIAFPAISCGVYGYPLAAAAKVAVDTIVDTIERESLEIEVQIVCFNDEVEKAFSNALALNRKTNGTREV